MSEMIRSFLSASLIFLSIDISAQGLTASESEALLNVNAINEKGKALEGEKISFVGIKTNKTYSGVTNSQGEFSILVPEGDNYKVKYKNFSTDAEYSTFKIPSIQGSVNFDYTLEIHTPKTYTLDNVFFDSGKSSLKQESFKELNELAEYMSQKKTIRILIAGHTDNVGNKESNMKLSDERANTVKNYLVKKGIVAERVQAKGFGDTQPVESNDTEKGRQKNRRTEVRLLAD